VFFYLGASCLPFDYNFDYAQFESQGTGRPGLSKKQAKNRGNKRTKKKEKIKKGVGKKK